MVEAALAKPKEQSQASRIVPANRPFRKAPDHVACQYDGNMDKCQSWVQPLNTEIVFRINILTF